jgi:integrase
MAKPRQPLTAIAIKALKPRAYRYDIPDPGCKGLYVRVFESGSKSYRAKYRFRHQQVSQTLGPCLIDGGKTEPDIAPEIGTTLSLAAARELCTKVLRQAKSGTDPAAAQRRKKQEQAAAESDTLQAIIAEYLRREGSKLRTLNQRRSDLELLASALGPLPIAEIRRGQLHRQFDHIADSRGPRRADRVQSATKTLLAWYSQRSDYTPVLGRGGWHTNVRERARSRVLSDDELRRVVETAEAQQRKGDPFGGFVLLLLHTATRRGEAAGLQRGELSDDGRAWTIPAARYKSKRDVVIPLSEAAQRIIAAQPQRGDLVFSVDGHRVMGDFDGRKRHFDKLAGVSGYVLHDLRRTARTLLSRCGARPDIAERILGHSVGGHLGAVYDQHRYVEEMREGVEALARLISHIVRPPPPVVTDIATARGKRRRP